MLTFESYLTHLMYAVWNLACGFGKLARRIYKIVVVV